MFKNENKGIVLKRDGYTAQYKHGRLFDLHAPLFISGGTNYQALKTIPLFSKHK